MIILSSQSPCRPTNSTKMHAKEYTVLCFIGGQDHQPILGGSINGGSLNLDVFFMENPSINWMIWRYPHFRKPPDAFLSLSDTAPVATNRSQIRTARSIWIAAMFVTAWLGEIFWWAESPRENRFNLKGKSVFKSWGHHRCGHFVGTW